MAHAVLREGMPIRASSGNRKGGPSSATGSQGHAHCPQPVGRAGGRQSGGRAAPRFPRPGRRPKGKEGAGLRGCCRWADAARPRPTWIMILLPDTEQGRGSTRPRSPPTSMPVTPLFFAHGFQTSGSAYDHPAGRCGCGHGGPQGPGHLVRPDLHRGRRRFHRWLAVSSDPSGKGARPGSVLRPRHRAPPRAAGVLGHHLRRGRPETDLFRRAGPCSAGGMDRPLVQAGYETLVGAGYQPEVGPISSACNELKLIVGT